MAFITVKNTFVDTENCDATELNNNFTDVVNGLSDGTKNIQVDNLVSNNSLRTTNGSTIDGNITVGSTLSVKGAVVQSGTLTITASLLSGILVVPPEDKTLVTGAIVPTKSHVELTGEGGAADDLTTVTATNFSDGDLLLLRVKTGEGYAITIKNGTGNILCGEDRSLSNDTSCAILQYDDIQSKWVLLTFSDN